MSNPSPSSPPLGVSKDIQKLVDEFDSIVTHNARLEGAEDPTTSAEDQSDYTTEDEAKSALLTAIAALEAQVPQWQPIATAPKDGTPILTAIAGFVPSVNMWIDYGGRAGWGTDPEEFVQEEHFQAYWESTRYEPSHWMPLPPFPTGP